MRNMPIRGNTTSQAIRFIQSRLPNGWEVSLRNQQRLTTYQPDALVEVCAPDGRCAFLLLEVKNRLTTQQAANVARRLGSAVTEAGVEGALLVTRYVSPLTRKRLDSAGISYLDLTGNARIRLDNPAVLIETRGQDKNPDPSPRPIKSLKGAKAARIVRALCDWRPPVGVRQLAMRAGADPGYTSRVLSFLEQEDVVGRNPQGEVTKVRWQDLLRRWAQDYQVTKMNSTFSYLAPRGVAAFVEGLPNYDGRWALTGSLALPASASIAPARLATCYIDDPGTAAKQLRLREADSGTNVLLLEPFDRVIWKRTRKQMGLTCVGFSQCVVDLLTGTGREPEEAESLMSWMAENEDAWRD